MDNFLFFPLIFEFLQEEIDSFQSGLLGRFAETFGILSLGLLTVWIFIQGWRVMSGRSREPLMGLVGDALKAMLVIGIATGFAGNSSTIYSNLTTGLGEQIYGLVADESGQSNADMFDSINTNLEVTSLAMSALAAVGSSQTGGDGQVDGETSMLRVMVMLGIGGPAITGGAMVLMYEVAMALFVGLGPLFIVCLLFDATRQLFSRWLMYGAGMMFSLATLFVLSKIAMALMVAVATAQWLSTEFQLANTSGLRETAMQTAGLGLILTTMLITCPPMAASFFQGMMASFSPYSAIMATGPQSGQPGPQGQPAGSYPQQVGKDAHGSDANTTNMQNKQVLGPAAGDGSSNLVRQDTGARGAANPWSPNYSGGVAGFRGGTLLGPSYGASWNFGGASTSSDGATSSSLLAFGTPVSSSASSDPDGSTTVSAGDVGSTSVQDGLLIGSDAGVGAKGVRIAGGGTQPSTPALGTGREGLANRRDTV
ncbi:MAG: type IV secretion system protein [Pseudoxanthomonas sp.]